NGIDNGSKIVKEIQYAKYKGEAVIPFKAMNIADPSFYNTLIGIAAVIAQRAIDSPFDIFMSNNNPVIAPVAIAATLINSTGFRANWNIVTGSLGYVITVKQGSTTVDTINISGQNTISQDIAGLSASTAYTYTIQANNGSLLSSSSNSISVSTTSGILSVSTIAGTSAGFLDDQGSVAQFNSPFGITVDSLGNIYVADRINNKIRKIANDVNHTVSTIAGTDQGHSDGSGSLAQFNLPHGIAVDSSGNLYIADTSNNKIRKIANDANHTVSTIAGTTLGYLDGEGSLAQFSNPQGITIDSLGNLYVADSNNRKIRKIANDVNHTVSTIAGTDQGYLDGEGSTAKFSNPVGVTIDLSSNIYVVDNFNHKIRKIANDVSHTVSTIAGTGGYN
ncbi:hypothetical protein EON78_06065, partial [bacterium]